MSQEKPEVRKARGGRPTKKEAKELDQRILQTAATLFATQGFTATSMEQVATACNAGKDTIYRRYPSKAALFTALMEEFRNQVVGELDAFMKEDGSPIKRLCRYARLLLTINVRPHLVALNRVALSDAVPFGGVKPTPTTEDPFMSRFAALVKEAQADGSIMEGDAFVIAEQLLCATSMKPLIATMLGEVRFSDPVEQQRYFDQAWAMFMDGVRSR